MMIKDTIEKLIALYDDPIISGLVAAFVVFIVSNIAMYIFLKRKTIFQTYLYINTTCIICNCDKYKIADIPKALLEYRKKLHSMSDDQNLTYWNTRISTFIIFTDGKSVLLYDRKKEIDHQAVLNNKLDCHGAVAFHNPTLEIKLSKDFMDVRVEKMEPIPGLALEKTAKKLWKLPIISTKKAVVMMGFATYIDTKDLEKGVDENNSLYSISCLSSENNNLTSKAKLSIRHLINV